MKIAFVTIGDTRDIRRGSGTPYHLWKELERQGVTVHLVGPLDVDVPFPTRLFKFISKKLGKKYFSHRDPFMGKALGREAARLLANLDYDVLLTNDYCLAGYTPADKPVVLFTDDIFPLRYADNINSRLENLSGISVYFCQRTTAQGLKAASKCIFASQFAAEEARKYREARGKFIDVVPYGANIPDPGNASRNRDIRQKQRLDLLFVGKDWERKGGDKSVSIARSLNQRGIRAHLHIVGVDLSAQYPQDYLTFYGLLNKDEPKDRARLDALFSTSDILLVPSKAEGYGLVFVEAAAYGLPSLAYRTTGVITAVQDGVSGVLLDLSEDESAFTNQIENWVKHPEEYDRMSKGARRHFEETGNWAVSVKKLLEQIQGLS
jgi:glycosyltransferase involved in cell wall biosynthesis